MCRNRSKINLAMSLRFGNFGNDSSLHSPNLSRSTNESNTIFARPVVGVRKARRLPRSCASYRTGDSFQRVDWSGEKRRTLKRGRTWRFGKRRGLKRILPSNQHAVSLPACHCGSVIPASGSGKPLNRECRALARATSGSLTTRIPKALEWGGGRVIIQAAGMPHVSVSEAHVAHVRRFESCPPLSGAFGRVGARAVSYDRTYRRSETEQKVTELRENRGERSSQTLVKSARVKAARLESRENSS